MSTDRIKNAMDRIDRALARIETQAALASHPPAQEGTADAALVARHRKLQETVASSIAELDSLIEGLER